MQRIAIHHEAAAASRADFLQSPYRGLERGADRKDQPRTHFVNALVCGNRAGKGKPHHSAAKMLDFDKIGHNYIWDNDRFDDSIVLKHRNNPVPHDPQTSCAGKGRLSMFYKRSLKCQLFQRHALVQRRVL